MSKKQRLWSILGISIISFLTLSDNSTAQKTKEVPQGTPIIWQEPGDVSTLDLYAGPGGEAMKPDLSTITFIKDETGKGYSTKYRVRDAAGRVWVAKVSKEAQPETVANRLMWAAGYFTETSYLIPKVEIPGKGVFENIRFEAREEDIKRAGEWSWDKNPFVGTREFQGLKVMMVLLNNWDIKDENTKILVVQNKETGENQLRYIVSDLGGTLGKTGNFITRSRNEPSDFVKADFVKEKKGNFVYFNYGGKRGDLFRNITIDEARWVGKLLARLNDQQLADAFRAGNYSPEETQMLAKALRARISELASL